MHKPTALGIAVLGVLAMLALLASLIAADLSCDIRNTNCDEATLLYLSNDSGGFDNAHAELANHSPVDYAYRLCCNSTQYAVSGSCGTTFLKLSDVTNAHVQDPAFVTSLVYNQNACIAIGVPIYCQAVAGACPSEQTCLVSIASSEGDNLTNAHVASCGFYTTSICCRTNSPPNVTNASITPLEATTNTTLSCINGTVTDPDNDTVTLHYDWFNGSQWMGIDDQNLSQTYTRFNQTWNCSITPNDGSVNGTTVYSTGVFINNTAPTDPVPLIPENGNATLFWRNVSFGWNASYDPDAAEGTQALLYDLNITSSTCADHPLVNISLNYTLPFDLECVGRTYYWQIRAFDGIAYSNWSATFNFTIEPTVVINLTQNTVDFGSLGPRESKDTTSGSPQPFMIENQGNVHFDTRFYAQTPLWTAVTLNTSFFQIKAREQEAGAFSQSDAKTQLSFVNVTGTNSSEFLYIIGNMSYVDAQDAAYADVRVDVPVGEPTGAKSSTLVFGGDPIVT